MDSKELAGLRVAIYARFSSENQRDASIEEQVERCSGWIAAHGGVVDAALIFADRAMSGGGGDRPDYLRMLNLASAPRRLDVIVVEELARLSRDDADLFTTKRMLKFEEVRLIGVTDGVDTGTAGGDLTFGLKSIIASAYTRELSDKTKRGLVGRAKLGLSTGGRTFGYRTEPETGPNGQTTGYRRVVDEFTAEIVRRIFQLYRDGFALAAISKQLNADKVPPPRGDHPLRRDRGWVHTTVRSMLHNATYCGVVSYNDREWRKLPGTNKRRYRRREAKELIQVVDPKLRIIDEELWDAVQERLAATRAYYTKNKDGSDKGRALAGRTTPYLFSKLLKCGLCGSPMVISGGSSTRNYRCSDHIKRGTCANALSVREDVLRKRLLEELLHTLARPSGLAFARKCIAEDLGEVERQQRAKLTELRRHATEVGRKLDALLDFIADGHARSNRAALGAKLEALEAEKLTAERAIRAVERQSVAPVALPTPDEMLGLAYALEARMAGDTVRGREELRELFKDGLIALVPQPGGYYVARSAVLPLVLITKPPPEETRGGGFGTQSLVARGRFEPPFGGSVRRRRASCRGGWARRRGRACAVGGRGGWGEW
jgi:site-specific DNA recombinase